MNAIHALSQLSYGPFLFKDLRSKPKGKERMNLETLFQQFLKEKRYLKNLSQHTIEFYERAFKQFNLQEPITKSQLNERVTAMREAGKSPACVDAHTRGINPFLTWLHENEYLGEHLKVKRAKLEQRVMRTFSEAELKALVSYKPKDYYERRTHAMLCLILDTGIRINEALTLKRSGVDFDNLLVTVLGKGNKERVVPFSLECRKVLFKFLRSHTFDHVFPTQQGGRLGYDHARMGYYRYLAKAGVEKTDGSFHAFRRAFARGYVRNGGNLFYLMKALGHTTLSMSKKYVEVEVQDLQDMHVKTSLLSRLK